jgi:hypothetical protein
VRILSFAFILALASSTLVSAAAAEKPRVSRAAVAAVEKTLDNRLGGLWPDDPLMVVGLTQGVYISGYGVVFTGEVNIAPAAGISPFHQTITKEEVARIHDKKLQRLAKLKDAMEDMLLSSAASLDAVPAEEQIAIAVSLFYWHWENTAGLPAQIVMRAPKRTLVMVKAGLADRSVLTSTLAVEEF